jgi:predicted dienelactone hydrolase
MANWRDAGRDREIPVCIYLPQPLEGRAPLVVFSHGLGSSRSGYRYLGKYWASFGYVALHVTHRGSDEEALRGPGGLPPRSLADYLADTRQWVDRPLDVSCAITRALADRALAPHVDPEAIGVAGHSYGAFTALALAGLRFDLPDRPAATVADPRVRAAIVMSPQSQQKFGLRADSWETIDRPVLALTGTRDREYGVGSAAPRRTSFDRTPAPDQFLVTITDATHATFNDPPALRVHTRPPNPRHHAYICLVTTRFWDSYLRRERGAREWLNSPALETLSGGACRLETRRVTPPASEAERNQDRQ